MRKWRENFLIISLYPPSLSISYIKICHILSQNVKYGIFVANVTKTEHTRYEEIILGRILCEEAPQVVSACTTIYFSPTLLRFSLTFHLLFRTFDVLLGWILLREYLFLEDNIPIWVSLAYQMPFT